MILLFNVSLAETVRALGSALRRPFRRTASYRRDETEQLSLPDLDTPAPAPARRRRVAAPPDDVPPPKTPAPVRVEEPEDELPEYEEPEETAEPPVVARIIGSSSAPAGAAPAPPPIPREWHLPVLSEILEDTAEQDISEPEIRTKVRVIEETLAHFGVPAQVTEVNQGPTITQFGVEPGFVEQKGTDGRIHRVKIKVSRISALQHDLELALAAAPIRIEAPVPGRSVVGIEVPNSQVGMVSLRGILESEGFTKLKGKLRIALGQDVAGQPVCADLTTMPHLLIAGATGSGKSVCVNSIVAALLCTATPAQVQFVMIDPKRVELINYNGIPHLIGPVVVEGGRRRRRAARRGRRDGPAL